MSWYEQGVVTLTNGSKTVTAVGAAWLANVNAASALQLASGGRLLQIESITSDNALQLSKPYAGASASGVAYEIIPTQGLLPPLTRQVGALLASVGQVKDAYEAGDLAGSDALAGAATKADLAAPSTLPMGGFSAADAQSIFDNALSLQSYSALRVYTGRAQGIKITSPGISGQFHRDTADTVSVDNGGTVIVDAAGRRWKRVFNGAVGFRQFGAVGDGVTEDGPAMARAAASGLNLVSEKLKFKFSQPLLFSGVDVDFGGSALTYTGPLGSFALTFFSPSSSFFLAGNSFGNFILTSSSLDVTTRTHGVCIGGVYGRLYQHRIIGFTGVSLGLGGGVEPITGVNFTATQQCYYWTISTNICSAAGWNIVIKGSNNANTFDEISTFPYNAWNDSVPRRANCINQIICDGLTNIFKRVSLEGISSGQTILFGSNANTNDFLSPIYFETNSNFVTPGFPRVSAAAGTSANRLKMRHQYQGRAILDLGVANDFRVVPAFGTNGMQELRPIRSRNLVFNGDFENGVNGWSNFGTNTVVDVLADGYLSGKAATLVLTAGRPAFQQSISTLSGLKIAGLRGQTITVGAWIETDVPGIKLRLGGITGNVGAPNDGLPYFITTTMRVTDVAASLDLAVITDASGLTGTIKVSNITAFIGLEAYAAGERTQPTGSVTYNPPSIAAGAEASTTVTVLGAAFGDFVVASFGVDTQGIKLNARVSAADTVTVIFRNDTAAAIDLGSAVLRARVIKA